MDIVSKRSRAPRLERIVFLALLLAGGATFLGTRSYLGPSASFKRFVIRPIPGSVCNIKVDRRGISSLRDWLDGFRDNAIVLRFDINRECLSQIVAIRGFALRQRAEYRDGDLHYQVNDQYYTVMRLYREKTREPAGWFDLQKWTDFQRL
jgi:hypothetical protein